MVIYLDADSKDRVTGVKGNLAAPDSLPPRVTPEHNMFGVICQEKTIPLWITTQRGARSQAARRPRSLFEIRCARLKLPGCAGVSGSLRGVWQASSDWFASDFLAFFSGSSPKSVKVD